MDTLILEITHPDGHRDHHPLGEFPFRLGRGYHNHVVLSDAYASARHLEIEREADGQLFVRDCGSENGSYISPTPTQRLRLAGREPLALGQPVHVGKTTIAVFAADTPVAPALPLDPAHHTTSLLRHALTALVPLLLLLLLVAGLSYLTTSNDEDFAEVIASPIFVALGIATWAASWAFVSRLFVHRANFLAHAGSAAAVVLGVVVALHVQYGLLFSLESSTGIGRLLSRGASVIEAGIYLVALYLLLSSLLRNTFPMSATRRRQIAAGIPLALLLLVSVVMHYADESTGLNEASAELMLPVGMRLGPVKTPEEMLEGMSTLEREVMDAAGEAPPSTER